MADKGDAQMSVDMLAAFGMFCKQFATPESVRKHLAATIATIIQEEAEKVGPSNQSGAIVEKEVELSEPSTHIDAATRPSEPVPPTSSINSARVESDHEKFEKISPFADMDVILLPDVADHLPNISDSLLLNVVAAPDSTLVPFAVGDSSVIADPTVDEAHPTDFAPPYINVELPFRSNFVPEQYRDMSTLDVVKDILGMTPQPFRIIPLSEPENPLDYDRDIDLACTARDLLKAGKTGKMPVRSSARIIEETISKLIKKGDERCEMKKAATSNPERGLVDEAIFADEEEPEHSFDDSEDLNFVPPNQHSDSIGEDSDFVPEVSPSSKHAKRKLHIDESEVSKPVGSKQGKKQKLTTPAMSTKSAKLVSSSLEKSLDAEDLLSSDSSNTKKCKEHCYKSTAPAPRKNPLATRSSSKSKKFAHSKVPVVQPRKNVGHAATPTRSSPGSFVLRKK